jgi:hypothetical protein
MYRKYLENSEVYPTRSWREVHVFFATKSRPPLGPTDITSDDTREFHRFASVTPVYAYLQLKKVTENVNGLQDTVKKYKNH